MSRNRLALALALCCLIGEGTAFAGLKQAGSLKTPRYGHTATLLPSSKVLIVGGLVGGEFLPGSEVASGGTELYDPATGIWSVGASLLTARTFHTATLLPSGKVLVAGGGSSGFNRPLASAEVFDPSTQSWEPTGSLTSPRYSHTATLLPSGEVLVTGGIGPDSVLAGAELYDPETGQWRPVPWEGGAPPARVYHTATLLPSGEVLVAAGRITAFGPSTDGVEIYQPGPEAWRFSTAAPLAIPRSLHTATLLVSGEVLFASDTRTEIYHPEDPTSSQLLDGIDDRIGEGHVAALLPSGKVLLAGGHRGEEFSLEAMNSVLLFNPTTGSWSAAGTLSFPATYATAILLPSGRLLIAGGMIPFFETFFIGTVHVYDQDETASWEVLTGPSDAEWVAPPFILLNSGKVLVQARINDSPAAYLFDENDPDAGWQRTGNPLWLGSATGVLLPSGEALVDGDQLYDPATGSWRAVAPAAEPLGRHTATLLPSEKVLVAGGQNLWTRRTALYDPESDSWQTTGNLLDPRRGHAAELLPSGELLVAGGTLAASSAEIYDPETGAWRATGNLREPHDKATAVLLPSGKVLVRGADQGQSRVSEVFDPASGVWSLGTPSRFDGYNQATALLSSGKILFAGGYVGGSHRMDAELYDPLTETWEETAASPVPILDAVFLRSGRVLAGSVYGMAIYTPEAPPAGLKPAITRVTEVIRYGETLEIEGTGFRGSAEAFPLIRLHSVEGDRMWWLAPAPIADFGGNPMLLQVVDLPPGLVPGSYLVSVVAAGVASEPVAVRLECSVGDPVLTADVIPGPAITFRARSQGARYFRWRKDGVPIAGANAATYTTPPLTAADQGSVYTVEVDSSCREKSAQATVTLPDEEPPVVANISPRGGEYWLLSPPGTPDEDKNRELVSWSMSDNLRICKVAVRLVYSTDGGATYQRIAGPALWTEGTAGACTFGHEAAATSFEHKIPSEPPGAPGALYKIEVEVTDYDTDSARNDDVPTTPCQSPARADGARTTIACSANPFFIVQSNPDSVRTLILTHSARMERFFPGTRQELATGLRNLANHPRVQGFVVDLANATGLGPLYDAWDAAPADPAKANEVLFGDSGLHDYLREEIFPKLTGVRYLVLVGDDRIIPFARVPDGTALSESSYVDVPGGDLTSQSTVGKALASGFYLSDDPLASRQAKPPFSEKQIREGAFLPDLAAGRLVETPEEIIATIARFISKDGLLDLSGLGEQGHKVLVTGYDFLIDAGRKVRQRWESALDQAGGGIAPVNGALLTPDWGESSVESRRQALRHHLAGSGGAPYAIVNLNGHATHHQEGVPGTGTADIQGLSSEDLPDVEGTVIYGVGCHGGLSVPGSAAGDHPHDLPQAFLLRGALAYIANTGYGWGLETGIGYGERIVELFTEEMTAGGTVVVGDAVQRAKLRYFLQVPGAVNGYDEKTLLQWTLFGLPMYAVRTGIGSRSASASAESMAPATVERRLVSSPVTLPRFLTQLNLHFDFSAEGVYSKHDSLGNPIAGVGCPDPAGCYYNLNGVTGGGTGTTDLPIQPYFVYNSRLSGTSQHGALWTGGTYVEEGDWKPVIAKLASNGGDFSNHGSTPRMIKVVPLPHERPTGGDESCRPNDLDLSTLVVVTGEVLEEGGSWSQRLYQEIDLEVLYFNDQGQPGGGNCDRQGPDLGAPPFGERYHRLNGSTVEWAVPASDEGGVWRVLVVYDTGPDDQGRGSWRPIELADDGAGVWRGSLPSPDARRLTYFVQAVDRRGNVAWLDFASGDLPASGVPHDLPLPVEIQDSRDEGPLDFYTVAPCRMVDTRGPAGPVGGPSLACGQERLFALTGQCGVPATARAVAANLTVVRPTAHGHLQLYPEDEVGTVTSVLNFAPGLIRANNAVVHLGTTGRVKALCAGPPGALDLIVDVVGYFE